MEIDLPFDVPDYVPIEDDPHRYMSWVRMTQPCLISKQLFADCHHVKSRGAGGKERENIVPLKHKFHMELHNIGRHTFAKKYGIDLKEHAIRITELYEQMGEQ